MKTLGYFQFGTQPGIYRLNCDTNLMSILENHDIVVKDLSGLNLNLDISYNKNPVSTEITPFQDTRIHIFSLASGKTYEKFLKIMISSVLYNTKSKIKF